MGHFDEGATWTDDWGIIWHSDGESEAPSDPGWDFIFDDSDDDVFCPECRKLQLYYHQGEGRCIVCHATFTDQEITDWAGIGWRHGRV